MMHLRIGLDSTVAGDYRSVVSLRWGSILYYSSVNTGVVAAQRQGRHYILDGGYENSNRR